MLIDVSIGDDTRDGMGSRTELRPLARKLTRQKAPRSPENWIAWGFFPRNTWLETGAERWTVWRFLYYHIIRIIRMMQIGLCHSGAVSG